MAERGARDDRKGPRESAGQVPGDEAEHVAGMFGELLDDRGLETGVHRAVGAQGVLARLPVVPVGAPPELVPGERVLLADQVARALPAVGREGNGAPG